MTPRHRIAPFFPAAVIGLLVIVLSGCADEAQIERYRVAKPPLSDSAGPTGRNKSSGDGSLVTNAAEATDRMLAAIASNGEQAWFFKLVGPKDQLAQHDTVFRDFVKSIRIADEPGAKPTWQLPEGWQRQAGAGMRYATLTLPVDDGTLELTVISLPIPAGDPQQYLLWNVNRWRREMSLPALALDEIGQQVEQLDADGRPMTLVDLIGRRGTSGMTAPPRSRPNEPTTVEKSKPAEPVGPPTRPKDQLGYSPSVLTCKAPEGWKPLGLGIMRAASFEVRQDGRKVEISVIDAGGDLWDNVNRWRGQLQLPRATKDELEATLQKVRVGQTEGHYIELFGTADAEPREAILGAIVNTEGHQWFVKLTGDASLAEREKERFKAFLKSLEFAAN